MGVIIVCILPLTVASHIWCSLLQLSEHTFCVMLLTILLICSIASSIISQIGSRYICYLPVSAGVVFSCHVAFAILALYMYGVKWSHTNIA